MSTASGSGQYHGRPTEYNMVRLTAQEWNPKGKRKRKEGGESKGSYRYFSSFSIMSLLGESQIPGSLNPWHRTSHHVPPHKVRQRGDRLI
jgi:hypothetical protein